MSARIKRRAFITLLGGAAAWPLAARAQQPAVPVIGFLGAPTAKGGESLIAAFRKGLTRLAIGKGQLNVATCGDGNGIFAAGPSRVTIRRRQLRTSERPVRS
jgi:hypothetical protein